MLIPFKKLPHQSIKGIIHIGAHEAEEMDSYLECHINQVLWVEANPNLYPFLREKINLHHPGMRLGEFAAGEKNEQAHLNIANNGQSSSLLEMGSHLWDHPDIAFIDTALVEIRSIDNWLTEIKADKSKYNFLNIDIQGYELLALKGCTEQLQHTDFIYVEVNKKEVYKGCAKLDELDGFLAKHGLTRVATIMTRNGWGDAFYAKKNHSLLRLQLKIVRLTQAIERISSWPGKLKKKTKGFLNPVPVNIQGSEE
jgi:FkbM family methyltransferase